MIKGLLICLFIAFCDSAFYLHSTFNDGSTLNSIHFSPDASMVVLASTSTTHNIYYFPGMTVAYAFTASSPSTCAKFSSNQLYVAFALSNYKVVIKNTNDFSNNSIITSTLNSIQQIDFSSDSSQLILCGKNSSIFGYEIWSVPPGGTPLMSDYTYAKEGLACRFAFNGNYAVGDNEGNTRYYSSTYSLLWKNTLTPGPTTVESLAFARNSSLLAIGTGSHQKVYTFINLASNSTSNPVTRDDKILGLDFTEDGLYLASAEARGEIFIYNITNSYSYQFNVDTGNYDVKFVDFSKDSCWLSAAVGPFAYFYYNCTKGSPVGPAARCPIEQYLNSTIRKCRMCASDMIGCRKCTNSSVCLVCTDQYYLNSSLKCSPCTAVSTACVGCKNASICTQCAVNYYLNGTNCSLCFAAIKGCTICLDYSTCVSCSRNYYFDAINNNCLSCSYTMPNCFICNSSSLCLSCAKSYFIDASTSCSKCAINCSSCVTNSNNCLSCDNGFYLLGSSCLTCPWNCVTCSASNFCIMCIKGHYLSASTCLPCSFECQSCSATAYTCLSCNTGFFLSGNTCTLCHSNCSTCQNSYNYCLTCNVAFYINNLAHTCVSCTSIEPNCLLCNSSVCYECASGYFINGTVCQSCMSAISGCQICNSFTSCLVCSSHSYLLGSTCVLCSWPCVRCANSSACLGCVLGYYLNNSISSCVKCNCPTCSSSFECLSCGTGEYLSSGQCFSCSSIHPMCHTCNDSSHCLHCNPSHYLSASNCSLCPIGCSSCTDSATCKTCTLGYYQLSSTCQLCSTACSTCSSAINCIQCVNGYYLSAASSCMDCSSLLSGCDSCNSTVCWSCSFLEGYYMSSNQCYSCSTAINRCQRCIANNFCLKCQQTYTLDNSNSSCVSCSLISFCQSCSNTSHCDRCLSGYFNNGTSCEPCTSGCFSCSSSTVCEKCFPQFWLTTYFACTECASIILGCNRCSSLSICTECGFGYFLSGGTCQPCLTTMDGCLSCNISNICLSCQSGYYLNSTSKSCLLCTVSLVGCGFCFSSNSCEVCLGGYYLNSRHCILCLSPNCLTCNSSECYQCLSGFYLNGSMCNSCASSFSGCLMCNSTACHSCQTGYYSSAKACNKCITSGCQVCNNTNPSQCLGCSPSYYLQSSSCSLCQTVLTNCLKCDSSGSWCLVCRSGYYVEGSGCALCNTAMPNCLICSSNSLCNACDSGSLLIPTSCTLCKVLIDGCLFCQSSTSCSNCMQGYFLNSSAYCQSCSELPGCLICRNLNTCNFCMTGFLLQNGVCLPCNTKIQGCIACSSNINCLACQGNYSLVVSRCSLISSTLSYYPYEELALKSVYVNATTLKHTLWVYGNNNFKYTDMNLILHSNLSYVTTGGQIVSLVITGFQWGTRKTSIIFYSKNNFDLSQSSSSISFFDYRLLSYKEPIISLKKDQKLVNQRLMQFQTATNLQLNANFQLTMDEQAVLTILPSSLHAGYLFLTYNTNRPEFLASTLALYNFKFHYFGQVVSTFLLALYIFRGVVLDKKGKDKGQLSAHVLLMKTPVLMLYPTYAQLVDYCGGFMLADLPWLNNYFSSILSDPRDIAPKPYLMFFTSLSISSMYLLPVVVIVAIFIILKIFNCLTPKHKDTINNLISVVYCYFLGGLSFSAAACVQGAIINPMNNDLTVSSFFYLLGLVIFLSVSTEAIWSTCRDKQNLFKIRIIVKSTLLSVLHYSPIYLLPLVIGCEIAFIVIKIKLFKLRDPKLWLLTNILLNLALLLLVQFSHSMISIYLSAVFIVFSLLIQVIVMKREYKLNKVINEMQKNYREVDASMMRTLEVFREGETNNVVSSLFTEQNEIQKKQQNKKVEFKLQQIQNELDISQQHYYFISEELSKVGN